MESLFLWDIQGFVKAFVVSQAEKHTLAYVEELFIPLVVGVCDMMVFVTLVNLAVFSFLPGYWSVVCRH